jgi:4,5-dihydroxyphthalate decarboxylase
LLNNAIVENKERPLMVDVPITIAVNDYDRTRHIMTGRVRVEGCEVTFLPLEAEEVFFRAFRDQAFDVSELSFSSYMLQTTRGDCPYIGIPAFVSRMFRHSSIYIRTDRGIRSPADLRGRLIGVPEYQLTALVWVRGILMDEYGIDPSELHFRAGGQEQAGRDERTPLKLTNGVDLQPIPQGETLVNMLVEGKLDALFTARAPSCFVNGAPNIDRLFPDYREVEKQYYKKTRLFPIMHLIGIRKSLAEKHPWLPVSVYKAFCEAKALALDEVRDVSALNVTLPWVEAETLDTIRLMGKDYWKYGIAENLPEIEALARYSYEQGLATRKLTPEELFHKSTFEISKI